MTGHVTASPSVKPIPTATSDESSNSGEESLRTEFADRVGIVGQHEARLQELEQELERDQRARTFANEVVECERIGLSFSGKPGGNYRITSTSVGGSKVGMALLYRLAVAAARVGENQIVEDVVLIAQRSKPRFDDPRYPIWRQIYEAAYDRLDPKSPAAVALKKKFGA
jgi:hypothetical protein